MLIGVPPGPSGSTIAGILLFGLIFTKADANCSPLLILRPFGVFQVCNSMVIGIRLLTLVRANQDYHDRARLQDTTQESRRFTVERNRNRRRPPGSRGTAARARTERSAAWLRPSRSPCRRRR